MIAPARPVRALLAGALAAGAIVLVGGFARDQGGSAEAVSLFGQPLVPAAPAPEQRATLEANLVAARKLFDAHPDDPDAAIWVGRRLAYLGRYREAIAVFSKGIERFPDDARFLRHRGHRFITTRQFDNAENDLARAAALVQGKPDVVEPDGQPNARNLPRSTLQFNIWYHLGLARYLRGDFEPALRAYRECLKVAKNDDARVATSHWLYMTLRRLGRNAEAAKVLDAIGPKLDIVENGSYERLLAMYKGELTPEALLQQSAAGLDRTTVAYGVGNWHYYNHRQSDAEAVWRTILHGTQWAAFGSIAAEADLHRLERPR
jgi:tetratricopeptide (TPR) repeat protein